MALACDSDRALRGKLHISAPRLLLGKLNGGLGKINLRKRAGTDPALAQHGADQGRERSPAAALITHRVVGSQRMKTTPGGSAGSVIIIKFSPTELRQTHPALSSYGRIP